MAITKQELVAAFGLKPKETKKFDNCNVRRDDYFGAVEITITCGEKVVLRWDHDEVEVKDGDSPVPIMTLWGEGPVEIKNLLGKIFGEVKLKSMVKPQGNVALAGGFAGILVAHDSASLTTPAGFANSMQMAAAMLLVSKTGRNIASGLKDAGATININYMAGKFSFNPSMASDEVTLDRQKGGVLLADLKVPLEYLSVQRMPDDTVGTAPYSSNLSVLLGHELIHAIHAYEDIAGYSERARSKPAHEDWEDLEEQYTITGVLAGKRIPLSECDILAEYGYPARWGHTQYPTVKGAIDPDLLEKIYGSEWQERIRYRGRRR